MRKSAWRWLRPLVLMAFGLLFFAFIVGPFYWMVVTSMMSEREMFSVPPHFFPSQLNFSNYLTVLGIGDTETLRLAQNRAPAVFDIRPGLINSLVIGVCVAIANLAIATPAAYSFSRLKFVFSLPLLLVYLGTRMVPPIMLVVPMFLIVRNAGLIDTPLALILVYVVLTLPFSIWLLQSYFRTVPVELEEAAVIDGANRWQTIWQVLLPVSIPGLTCVAILSFMGAWSEFLFAVTFSKTIASRTLPVVAASFSDTASIQFDFVMTAGVITALPPFILALVFQRFIVGGLSAGAVKG